MSQDIQYYRTRRWFELKGDNNLRLDYNLTEDSVVLDVGGYIGEWSSEIYRKYKCHIYIFEPVKKFAAEIQKKFAGNKKVHVLSYGISDKAQELEIILEDNSSSVFDIKAPHSKKEKIQLVKFSEEMQRLNIKKIDLLKINSEGGEYGLLANALETGWLQRITNIQVQFHDFVPEAYQQMRKLQQEMLKTHYPTYQYDFVWDNWRLRGKDEGKDLLKFYLSELQLERERFALLGQQYDDLIEKVPHLENRITDLEAETTWAKDKLAHTEHMLSSLENSRGVRALRTMRLPLKWLVRRVKKIT